MTAATQYIIYNCWCCYVYLSARTASLIAGLVRKLFQILLRARREDLRDDLPTLSRRILLITGFQIAAGWIARIEWKMIVFLI